MQKLVLVPEPMARWSYRLGLFALALAVTTFLLHRVGQMSTPVALNAGALSLAVGALAVLCGLWAGGSIWFRGRAGAVATAVGMLAGVLPWLVPAAAVPNVLAHPALREVSTDTVSPPVFVTLAKQRGPGANPAAWSGARTAQIQAAAYPDLRTLVVERSLEEVFDLAVWTVRGRRGLGWRVVVEDQPVGGRPGLIEATERTLVTGFVDDIAIRVSGRDGEARVDVRSASRYGQHDLGANATRVRRFMRELQARLESTTPGSRIGRMVRGVDPTGLRRPLDRVKGAKGANPKGAVAAPGDGRRQPAQKPPRG
jgi:glycerol-3-phosphate acyltransferase PlsY